MARPQIRLKGFNDEWNESSFDCLFSVVNDSKSNVPKSEYQQIGTYPVVDQSKKYIVGYTDGNNPIIPQKSLIIFGDHTREIKYIDFPFYTGADGTKVLKCKNQDSMFLYYLVSSLHIPNTGYNRHFKYLRETVFAIPESSTEQEEIAKYFRSLDALIQAAAKKIDSLKQMKAACLQSMFPQPGETAPKVRFKGFTGDWESSKLKSFVRRVTRKNKKLETLLPLTISSQDGLVSQIDYFNNVVASSNLSGYYLIKKGEFAYNKSYSSGYPFGSVKRLDAYEMGALSTLYIVFEIVSGISSNYLACFFDTSLWYDEVNQRAAEGARNHGLLNISAEDFLDINIMLPKSPEEQEKIASFFSELDNQIRLHEQRLGKLKQIKASCLDKMFV